MKNAVKKTRRAAADRGTAVAVAVSAAVVMVSTILIPLAVDGAAAAAATDELSGYESRVNLDPVDAFEDMSDSELDICLGKLHDYAVELKKESRALAAQRFPHKKWGRSGRSQQIARRNKYRSNTAQPVRSSFYDYYLLERPFAFGGMKRSGSQPLTIVGTKRRSDPGRRRAMLYGNSAVRLRKK